MKVMKDLNDRYNRILAKVDNYKDTLVDIGEKIQKLHSDNELYTKSRWALIEAARITRENFKHEVDDLANLVIKSIFTDRNFVFSLDFYEARGQTECRPVITEDGDDFSPKDDLGGSTLDVLGIFFRPILWSLDVDRTRPTFILDEPGRFLDRRIDIVGETLSMISHNLNIQLIITSHNHELAKYADKAFVVTHHGKNSVVSEIDTNMVEAVMNGEIEVRTRRVRKHGNKRDS